MNKRSWDVLDVRSPGTNPIKILLHKFYSTKFFKHSDLNPKYFQPIKILEKLQS